MILQNGIEPQHGSSYAKIPDFHDNVNDTSDAIYPWNRNADSLL